MNIKSLFKQDLILLPILCASVFVYSWRVESLITVSGDLGNDLNKILEIVNGNLTFLGPQIGHFHGSSFYLGPLYYYLLLPFILLTHLDPIGSVIPIIFSKMATAVLLYFSTKKIFGYQTAIFTALIAAISPYWIDSLGFPSPPYFILPLVSLIILIVAFSNDLQGLKKGRFIFPAFFFLGFLSGLNANFHYLALNTQPALIAHAYIQKNRYKKILLIIGGFLVSLFPIIIFDIKNKFFLTNQLTSFFSSGYIETSEASFINNFFAIFKFLFIYTTGIDIAPPLAILLVCLIFFFSFKKIWNKQKPLLLFIAFLTVLNVFEACLYFGNTQPHYIASLYPVMFIFLGYSISELKKINKLLPIILVVTVTGLLLMGNDLFASSGHTMPEDLTLKEIRKISKIIAYDVQDDSFNITSTLDGDSRAMPYRYLVKVYGKSPQDVENYNKVQSLYIITRDPQLSIRENRLFEIASFQPSFTSDTWEIKGNIRLIKLVKQKVEKAETKNFVTIVNPVRARSLWVNQDIKSLDDQVNIIAQKKLPAAWLIAYDNLFDKEIVDILSSLNSDQEIGLFLEVSQKLATDARVSYKVSDGDYYRPDKVFLSGYAPGDKIKIIKTFINKFKKTFGIKSSIAGAWYIDSQSLQFLSKNGIKTAVVVSDQYDTDSARVWGQYFAFPYFPSKFNSIEPAKNQSNKIPIVNIQWAQRDPVLSYGKTVGHSRQSFQANDYLNNKALPSFFNDLLNIYLTNEKTPFNQITLGLEVGQEGVTFKKEFDKQLEKIANLQKQSKLSVIKMSDFADWYFEKYPGISPSHFIQKGENFWYMSPYFRLAIFKENNKYFIKDLRYYSQNISKDNFYPDDQKYLFKTIPSIIDQVDQGNQIELGTLGQITIKENFDRLAINADNKTVKIASDGLYINDERIIKIEEGKKDLDQRLLVIAVLNKMKNFTAKMINPLRYSNIDGKTIFGFVINSEHIVAISQGKIGLYKFDFQSLSKFKSPADLINKWRPWIE